jgi:hypothetical protein
MGGGQDTGEESITCVPSPECPSRSHEEHEDTKQLLQNDSTKTLLQYWNIEVHRETDARACQPQIADNLRDVSRVKAFHALISTTRLSAMNRSRRWWQRNLPRYRTTHTFSD